MESNDKTLTVVALGGNAILKPGQKGTARQQIENVNETMRQIGKMVDRKSVV